MDGIDRLDKRLQEFSDETRELLKKNAESLQQHGSWQNDLLWALNDLDPQRFRTALLTHLRFKEIQDREYAIPETYRSTYRWILQPAEQNGSGSWSSFVGWVQSKDEPLYWITGKPGSGKSTLMKFIRDEQGTRDLLYTWAEQRTVHIFSFYFWNSGSEMQMSQEGLLRTLLVQALEARPDLAPTIFPRRMETFQVVGTQRAFLDDWKWAELVTAFRSLNAEITSTENIAFFIDGLDEYDGSHEKLIELVRSIVDHRKNVKICVSSRPWVVFEDGFYQRPSLRLEELTRGDIKEYTDTKLEAHPVFRRLKDVYSNEAEELANDITDKAAGVFLWVVLVVQSLLSGLSEGERLSDLHARLDALPPDLEDLFWKILNSLDDWHFKRACHFFRTFVASSKLESLFTWTLVDMDEKTFLSVDWAQPSQLHLEADLMRRRLNACTRGLLHTTSAPDDPLPYHRVIVLHRTVKDFITRSDIRSRISEASEDYSPDFHLAKAYIWQMPYLQPDVPGVEANRFGYCLELVYSTVDYTLLADPGCSSIQIQFLDDMDEAAGTMFQNFFQDSDIDSKGEHWGYVALRKPKMSRPWSFLRLAVAWQLDSYLKAKLEHPETKLTQGELDDMLYLALTRWNEQFVTRRASTQSGPNYAILSLLIRHGANPKSKRKVGPQGIELRQVVRGVMSDSKAMQALHEAQRVSQPSSAPKNSLKESKKSRWGFANVLKKGP